MRMLRCGDQTASCSLTKFIIQNPLLSKKTSSELYESIIQDGYGRWLSNSIFLNNNFCHSAYIMEYCIIAALYSMSVPKQLKGHILGAIALGADKSDLEQLLFCLKLWHSGLDEIILESSKFSRNEIVK
jgi:hypothetical protein